MKEQTQTILQAICYNITPSLVDAVISAYGLAKDKGDKTNIEEILKLKQELNK
jgi:hypothetical protein